MNQLKKQFLLVLFTLCANLFTTGSVSAQTWSQLWAGAENPCVIGAGNGQVEGPGQGFCMCNSSYTYGVAHLTNCTMDGWVAGCWNPSNGTCNTCGAGGTVTLGGYSCFNSGQGSQGGTSPASTGTVCTVYAGAANGYSSTCVGSGTSTGGFSTN
jgi:hypothetical protein